MRIAVLANLKQNAPHWEGMSPDQWDDLDSPVTVNGIVDALRAGGHEATFIEASIHPPHNLVQSLLDYKPDLCFNIAESHFGDGREAQVPAILEMLRIPYTGSKVLTLAPYWVLRASSLSLRPGGRAPTMMSSRIRRKAISPTPSSITCRSSVTSASIA